MSVPLTAAASSANKYSELANYVGRMMPSGQWTKGLSMVSTTHHRILTEAGERSGAEPQQVRSSTRKELTEFYRELFPKVARSLSPETWTKSLRLVAACTTWTRGHDRPGRGRRHHAKIDGDLLAEALVTTKSIPIGVIAKATIRLPLSGTGLNTVLKHTVTASMPDNVWERVLRLVSKTHEKRGLDAGGVHAGLLALKASSTQRAASQWQVCFQVLDRMRRQEDGFPLPDAACVAAVMDEAPTWEMSLRIGDWRRWEIPPNFVLAQHAARKLVADPDQWRKGLNVLKQFDFLAPSPEVLRSTTLSVLSKCHPLTTSSDKGDEGVRLFSTYSTQDLQPQHRTDAGQVEVSRRRSNELAQLLVLLPASAWKEALTCLNYIEEARSERALSSVLRHIHEISPLQSSPQVASTVFQAHLKRCENRSSITRPQLTDEDAGDLTWLLRVLMAMENGTALPAAAMKKFRFMLSRSRRSVQAKPMTLLVGMRSHSPVWDLALKACATFHQLKDAPEHPHEFHKAVGVGAFRVSLLMQANAGNRAWLTAAQLYSNALSDDSSSLLLLHRRNWRAALSLMAQKYRVPGSSSEDRTSMAQGLMLSPATTEKTFQTCRRMYLPPQPKSSVLREESTLNDELMALADSLSSGYSTDSDASIRLMEKYREIGAWENALAVFESQFGARTNHREAINSALSIFVGQKRGVIPAKVGLRFVVDVLCRCPIVLAASDSAALRAMSVLIDTGNKKWELVQPSDNWEKFNALVHNKVAWEASLNIFQRRIQSVLGKNQALQAEREATELSALAFHSCANWEQAFRVVLVGARTAQQSARRERQPTTRLSAEGFAGLGEVLSTGPPSRWLQLVLFLLEEEIGQKLRRSGVDTRGLAEPCSRGFNATDCLATLGKMPDHHLDRFLYSLFDAIESGLLPLSPQDWKGVASALPALATTMRRFDLVTQHCPSCVEGAAETLVLNTGSFDIHKLKSFLGFKRFTPVLQDSWVALVVGAVRAVGEKMQRPTPVTATQRQSPKCRFLWHCALELVGDLTEAKGTRHRPPPSCLRVHLPREIVSSLGDGLRFQGQDPARVKDFYSGVPKRKD